MDFGDLMLRLEAMGVDEVLVPFFLIFVIVYAVLQKSNILGDGNKRFNVIVATIMALASVFPHFTGKGPDVIPIINSAIPHVGLLAVAIIMLLLLIGMFGEEWSFAGSGLASWIVIFAIGAVVYIFGSAAGWGWDIPPFLSFLEDPDLQALLIILIVMGVIIAYITRDDTNTGGKFFEKVLGAFDVLGKEEINGEIDGNIP